ncbi:hypothetical protein C1I63_00585 [Rathayibacter caricis DSM 15933]|jgi:hypothetical protein|uniref:Uncharacterized protein n=2 Tax=Rathayibacter caricis TaxID=110936 RepID=A0A2T4UPP6_9MICO|nr:hypothetical protein C1I63_00585 [Rathayibacter caricis DSM 15933]
MLAGGVGPQGRDGGVIRMKRIREILSRLLSRRRPPLPPDPFGEPGGPVVTKRTPDSVALGQLPINQVRANL